MDSKLKFNLIKEELINIIDDIIKKNLSDKTYDSKYAQIWANNIVDKVIQTLNQKNYGFKFVCCRTIFEKASASLNYSSTCFWNIECDGSLLVKFENDYLHCFINLYGISLY